MAPDHVQIGVLKVRTGAYLLRCALLHRFDHRDALLLHVRFNSLAFDGFGGCFWRFQDDGAGRTAVKHYVRRRLRKGMQSRSLIHNAVSLLPAFMLVVPQQLEASCGPAKPGFLSRALFRWRVVVLGVLSGVERQSLDSLV